MDKKHIVILGGGFAGSTLARSLEKRIPDDYEITLISQENHITYNPLLAEVVGASILPGHVVAPLRQMVKRTRVCMAKVTDIDTEKRQLHYLGEGTGTIDYDQLVLACGVNANLQLIPGMDRYALPLKTLGDAVFLRNRVMSRLEQAELQSNPRLRKWLTTFVVIGGGFSGVEVAGEITDFLHSCLRFYPRIEPGECSVHLLHNGERILPELTAKLGKFAFRRMSQRGLVIHLDTSAVRIDTRGAILDSGSSISGGTVISTIGTTPNPLLKQLNLPLQRGRLETLADLSVPGHPEIWAVGDCAAIVNAYDDKLSPPTAQFATRQAQQLAINLAAKLEGKATKPFRFKPLGQLASIGHNKAVAEIFGFRISGFVAWLMWRGVYLLKVPTLPRKVRVFFEWSWGMLFPADIACLRYTRTQRPTKHQEKPELAQPKQLEKAS